MKDYKDYPRIKYFRVPWLLRLLLIVLGVIVLIIFILDFAFVFNSPSYKQLYECSNRDSCIDCGSTAGITECNSYQVSWVIEVVLYGQDNVSGFILFGVAGMCDSIWFSDIWLMGRGALWMIWQQRLDGFLLGLLDAY